MEQEQANKIACDKYKESYKARPALDHALLDRLLRNPDSSPRRAAFDCTSLWQVSRKSNVLSHSLSDADMTEECHEFAWATAFEFIR